MGHAEPESDGLEPPRSRRPRDWRDPAAIGGIVTALTALVAAIAALRQPPPPERKAEAAYEVCTTELKRQNDTIQRMHGDQQALRQWLRGFYREQGIEIDSLPGEPPPQPVRFKVVPPASSLAGAVDGRRVEPVGVRVLTPLPRPAPKPTEPELPAAGAL